MTFGFDEWSSRPRSRIKGRWALLKSLRLLAIRVQRFANHRARSNAERRWAAVLMTDLQVALSHAESYDPMS